MLSTLTERETLKQNLRPEWVLGLLGGILFGAAFFMGWPAPAAISAVVFVFLLAAIWLAFVYSRPFVSGAIAGVIVGLVQFGIMLVLSGQFLERNPELADYFAQDSIKVGFKLGLARFMLVASIAYGLAIGLLAALVRALIDLWRSWELHKSKAGE